MSDLGYDLRLFAVGPVLDHVAIAYCDYNDMGWTAPDQITGEITRWIGDREPKPGDAFELRDYEFDHEGGPVATATLLATYRLGRSRKRRHAEFLVDNTSFHYQIVAPAGNRSG
jgi:hypothetical protein